MILRLLQPDLAERVAAFVPAILEPTDVLLVDTVAGRYGETNPDVLLALAFAVRAPRAGQVGVDLASVVRTIDDERVGPQPSDSSQRLDWPADPLAWQGRTLASAMVGPATAQTPFVAQLLRTGRTLIMTRRLWQEQVLLAARLLALAVPVADPLPTELVEAALTQQQLTGESAQAVRVALARRLTVVTGGPGTGKTYSIKRLLALLLENHQRPSPLRVELAAPTGKAAVRMAEAMREGLEALPGISDETLRVLGQLAPRTLHKLLGMRPDGNARFDADHPLEVDVLVVDEASMVDLTLMRRLLEAIPSHARLILLGDRDQLASVEAGTVLADLVSGGLTDGVNTETPLRQSMVQFSVSRRFADAPTIGRVAMLLQRGDKTRDDEALALLNGEGPLPDDETLSNRIQRIGAPEQGRPTARQLDRLAAPYVQGYVQLLKDALTAHGPHGAALQDPLFHTELLAAFERYRVLAVHRNGPLGVSGLERAMAERVRAQLGEDVPGRHGFWLGQPVLVTENAYDVGLMNGDIGLVLPTAEGLQAIFAAPDETANRIKPVPLVRLPQVTGALAMTVHKSQGSQFQRVALVLADRDSPIQTRELVYTGMTRASERLDWLGTPERMAAALARRVSRASGLADLLWPA